MGSSSAENDIGVFVGNKLSLQPALTTKTTDCIQGCMNRSTTGRLCERIISSALTLFRPHLDMVSSFASPSIRQTSNGGKIKAGPPGQLGLEDLLCEGRLKDQSLFSHGRGGYREPNSSPLVPTGWLFGSHAFTMVHGGNMRHKG